MNFLKGLGIGVIAAAILLIIIYGLSWIATCGLIKLITMCFGWEFSWAISTGIWIVLCIAKHIFSNNITITK